MKSSKPSTSEVVETVHVEDLGPETGVVAGGVTTGEDVVEVGRPLAGTEMLHRQPHLLQSTGLELLDVIGSVTELIRLLRGQ